MKNEFLNSIVEDVQQVGSVVHGLGTAVKETLQYSAAIYSQNYGFELTPRQSRLIDTGPLSVKAIMHAAHTPVETDSPTPVEQITE